MSVIQVYIYEIHRKLSLIICWSSYNKRWKEKNKELWREMIIELNHYEYSKSTAATLYIGDSKLDCIFCRKEHASQGCDSARDWPLERKWKAVNDTKVCSKCLQQGHYGKNCKAEIKCLINVQGNIIQ